MSIFFFLLLCVVANTINAKTYTYVSYTEYLDNGGCTGDMWSGIIYPYGCVAQQNGGALDVTCYNDSGQEFASIENCATEYCNSHCYSSGFGVSAQCKNDTTDYSQLYTCLEAFPAIPLTTVVYTEYLYEKDCMSRHQPIEHQIASDKVCQYDFATQQNCLISCTTGIPEVTYCTDNTCSNCDSPIPRASNCTALYAYDCGWKFF